jgi:hypothetical protein
MKQFIDRDSNNKQLKAIHLKTSLTTDGTEDHKGKAKGKKEQINYSLQPANQNRPLYCFPQCASESSMVMLFSCC